MMGVRKVHRCRVATLPMIINYEVLLIGLKKKYFTIIQNNYTTPKNIEILSLNLINVVKPGLPNGFFLLQ